MAVVPKSVGSNPDAVIADTKEEMIADLLALEEVLKRIRI